MKLGYIPEKCLKNHVKSITKNVMKLLIEYQEKRICKIYGNDGKKGTGFFCIIPIDDWNELRVLMTNNHILGEKDIATGKKINLTLDNDKEEKKIIINEKRIKYTNKEYDITIIEIKEDDRIKADSFFDIDNKVFDDFKFYLKQTVYLFHYPKGIETTFSEGILKNIHENRYTMEHLCDSSEGSSGGPLINSLDYKVIGIHIGGARGEKEYNLGTLIVEPIEV